MSAVQQSDSDIYIFIYFYIYGFSWWLSAKKSACNARDFQETQVWSLGQEDPLEKEMATHSSIPAWETPWTGKPGRAIVHGHKKLIKTEWHTTTKIHIYIHIFICMYEIHIYIDVCMHTHIYAYIHLYKYTHTHIYIFYICFLYRLLQGIEYSSLWWLLFWGHSIQKKYFVYFNISNSTSFFY